MSGNIAERIKKIREPFSRAKFASSISVAQNTLRNYEDGLSLPNSDTIAEICRVHAVMPEWLLLGTGPMRQSDKGPTSDAANQQHSEIIENRPTALADSRPLMSTGPIRQGFKEPLAASANLQHAEIAEIDKKRIAAWRLFSEEVPPEKCPVCAKWEQRFEASEQERRDLTAENRKLWQDNATLREKCARLEERSHRFEHRKSHDDIPSAG